MSREAIEHNRVAHDQHAESYDSGHTEIVNPVEIVVEVGSVARPSGVLYFDREQRASSRNNAGHGQFRRESVVWLPRRWNPLLRPSCYRIGISVRLDWRTWPDPLWMLQALRKIWPDDYATGTRIVDLFASCRFRHIVKLAGAPLASIVQSAGLKRWRTRERGIPLLMAHFIG